MELEIDFTKSAQMNADDFFERSKRAKKKAEGAQKAVMELEEALKGLGEETLTRKEVRIVEKREWYEKFNWFYASDGGLVIGGRSADQNEELYSRHFDGADLFFHSDIFGASVVLLKDGISKGADIREEAAQFAASFSSAWDNSQTTVDVYSLRKEQVTKSRNEGSLGKGSFFLKGEREWYKSMPLRLAAFVDERVGKIEIAPDITCRKLGIRQFISISVGRTKKSDAAKTIGKALGYANVDYIMQHLPTGPFTLKGPD